MKMKVCTSIYPTPKLKGVVLFMHILKKKSLLLHMKTKYK
jgi:hypothetical protein